MEVSQRQSVLLIVFFAFALLLNSSPAHSNHGTVPNNHSQQAQTSQNKAAQPAQKQAAPTQPAGQQPASQAGKPQGKKWCVPKPGVSDAALGKNIDFVCGNGIDCSEIKSPRACSKPDTVRNHAAYLMNKWYQIKGHKDYNCDFSGTGMVTDVDPSYDQCKFPA